MDFIEIQKEWTDGYGNYKLLEDDQAGVMTDIGEKSSNDVWYFVLDAYEETDLGVKQEDIWGWMEEVSCSEHPDDLVIMIEDHDSGPDAKVRHRLTFIST